MTSSRPDWESDPQNDEYIDIESRASRLFATALGNLKIKPEQKPDNLLMDEQGNLRVSVNQASQVSSLTERQIRHGANLGKIGTMVPSGRELLVSLNDVMAYPNTKRSQGRPKHQS